MSASPPDARADDWSRGDSRGDAVGDERLGEAGQQWRSRGRTRPDPTEGHPGADTRSERDDRHDDAYDELADTPPRRVLSIALAGLSGLLAVAMVLGVQLSHSSFALVVFGVQALFVVVWTVASQPPAPRIVATVGIGVAAVADYQAVAVDEASLAPLAYLTVAGFVAGVIGQLVRPAGRVRVTESLGSSLVVVLGAIAYATLVVLSRVPLGTQVITACMIGVGVALVVAHATDAVAPLLRVAATVPRGGVGIVAGAMLGTAAAGITGSYLSGLATLATAFAGLAASVIALMVDLSVNYAETGRRMAGMIPEWWLVRHMQGPLTALVFAAPTAYAASLVLARGL